MSTVAHIPFGRFSRAVRAVSPVASRDEFRPILGGVFLRGANGQLEVVATDSFRMFRARVDADVSTPFSALVPAGWLQRFATTRFDAKADVRLTLSTRRFGVACSSDERLIGRIEGEYPNVDGIFGSIRPDVSDETAWFEPSLFAQVFRSAVVFDNRHRMNRHVSTTAFDPKSTCRFEVNVPDDGDLCMLVMPKRKVDR